MIELDNGLTAAPSRNPEGIGADSYSSIEVRNEVSGSSFSESVIVAGRAVVRHRLVDSSGSSIGDPVSHNLNLERTATLARDLDLVFEFFAIGLQQRQQEPVRIDRDPHRLLEVVPHLGTPIHDRSLHPLNVPPDRLVAQAIAEHFACILKPRLVLRILQPFVMGIPVNARCHCRRRDRAYAAADLEERDLSRTRARWLPAPGPVLFRRAWPELCPVSGERRR